MVLYADGGNFVVRNAFPMWSRTSPQCGNQLVFAVSSKFRNAMCGIDANRFYVWKIQSVSSDFGSCQSVIESNEMCQMNYLSNTTCRQDIDTREEKCAPTRSDALSTIN